MQLLYFASTKEKKEGVKGVGGRIATSTLFSFAEFREPTGSPLLLLLQKQLIEQSI